MKFKEYSNLLVSSTSIAIIYFIVCSLYIIFSDKLLLLFFDVNYSNTALSEIQSYKGVFFVLCTSFLIYSILKKKNKIAKKHTTNLKNNQKQYLDLFKSMSHGVIYATPEGIVTSVNDATLNILGITEKEMFGKSIFDIAWKPIDSKGEVLDLFENPAKRAIVNKKPVRNTIVGVINVKTGLYVWLKVNAIPEFKNENEEAFRVCVTIDDITELKNYQQELEQSKEQINASLKKTQFNEFLLKEASKMTKIGVYEIYPETQEHYFSEELYRLFNLSPTEEFPFHRIPDMINKESYTMLQKGMEDCMKFGVLLDNEFEIEIETEEIRKYWIRVIVQPIYDNDKIIGRRGVVQDITESKSTQLALEKSLQLLEKSEYSIREAGRIAKIGYWAYDKDEDLISWSDEVHKIYGTNPDEGVPNLDVILSFFTEKSKKELVEATIELASKGTPYEVELNMINANNENIWIRNLGQPVYNKQNEIIGRRGVSQNITKEKNDQLALLKAKEKVERNQNIMIQASKVAKIGYWYQDLVNNTLTWSDYIYQLYKLKPEDDILKYEIAKSYFDTESQEKISLANKKLNENGTPYDLELRVVFSENEELWIRNMVQPVYNEHKEVIGKTGVIQNITEEKNLRELNRQVGSLAKIGSWELDLLKENVFWTNEVHLIHETDPNTYVPNLNDAINFYREDFHQLIKSSIEKCITKGESHDLEAVIVTANKNELWVRVIFKAEFVNDVCTRIYGSIQNIDERKQAEIAVKESEAKFRTIFEIASLGIAQVDPSNGKMLFANSYYETITGYSSDELLKMKFSELTHPNDVEKDLELFNKAARGEEDYSNEKRYIKKDGNIVWVRIHLAFIRDESGKPKKTVAICEDITQRKEAESRLQSLADNLPGVVFQYFLYPDDSDSLKAITAGSKEVWGFAAEDVEENNQLVWDQIKAGGDYEMVKRSILESIKTRTKWSAQWKYTKPNGEIKTHLGYGSPIFLADGSVLFNSVILDVTEEAKNEALLEQTNKIAKIGSWEMDLINQEGDNMYWSPSIKEILEIDINYNPTLKDGIEFHVGESRDRIQNALMLLINEGIEFDEEILLRTAKGYDRWCRAIGKSEIINGKRTRIYGSYQDIHEKKIATVELKKSLKSLEDFKYSLDQSAIIAFTNPKGEITSVNDNFCKISGYSQKEVLGKTHKILNSNYHPASFFKELWQTITSGKVWRGEIKNKAKVGSYYWEDSTIVPFLNENNKPTQYLSIRFDISERKKVEEEKTRFQETLEHSLNEVYMFDYETFKFIYVNKGALQNLGYSNKEIKTLTPLDLKPEHTASTFNELLAPLKNYEKEKIIFYTNHKRKDGSLYPVEVHLTLVEEVDNKNFIAIILDITERKIAEENLLVTTERLRIATRSVKIGIWDWDIVNDNLTWDDRMFELYGAKREDFDGALSAWENRIHPDDFEWASKHLLDTLNGVHNFDSVFRVVWPDKSIHYIEGNAIVIRDNDGNPLRMIGGNIDVTKSKNIQLEILEAKEQAEISEAKFKSYTEKSPVAIYTTNLEGDCKYVNETWLKIAGMNYKDALNKGWLQAMHPEDIEFVNENWYKSVKSKGSWKFEYRFINLQNKEVTWVEATAKELFNDKNELIGYLGTNVNITERKKAEENRKTSEAKFKSYTEKSPIAVFTTDLSGRYTYVNETWLKLTGLFFKEALSPTGWSKAVHPDDLKNINKNWYKSVKSNGKWKYEYRFINKKTNKIIWVEATAKELFNDKNELIGYLGTNVNITDRKKAEEMYRLLADNTNDIIALQEANANLKYISPAVENLLGYKQSELLNKQFMAVIHKEDLIQIKEEVSKKLLKDEIIEAITYRAQHKKGHFIWLETLISPIVKDNKIISLISTSRDITQWMSAKKEIEEYQSSLQKLTSEISLIEEKQKKEIAANIHDHLSQSLVISKMRITELEKKTELKNVLKDLEFIKSHVSSALENSRKITYELSPPVLYQLGVVHALDWYADEIEEKYGIKFEFSSNVDSIKLTDFKSILIFRCVQEAVTNVIKYAEATLITLELIKDKNAVDILITDNGKGFDTAVLNAGGSSSSGFGLFAVKERVRSMSGKLTITSKIKIGTKIKIYVPLEL